MGMTDRQFDSYKATLLESLSAALEEIEEKGECTKLKKIMDRIDAELRKP
ncbi:MAG: hypothetical protein FWD96_01605 [Defluviitaleaceae bacterium]|nr:hypothetical protein [Defluviitaleaceae bacterium]